MEKWGIKSLIKLIKFQTRIKHFMTNDTWILQILKAYILYLEKSACLWVGLGSLMEEWSCSQFDGGILRSVLDWSSWNWTGNST